MKLQRIRIEQFRKFDKPIEIVDFESGLNILHGPNEAGKSTIAQALRTLFFEKHNTSGKSFVSAISPAGTSAAAPAIEIDFMLGEQSCAVSKTFLQKARANLLIGTDKWDGGDADEKLAEVLGFGLSGKGTSRADTHGIPGLLWIEQGATTLLDDAVTNATGSLEERLKGVLGEIASSSGTRLAAAIKSELAKLRTATGRSTGVLAETEKRLVDAVRQRDTLRESVDQYRVLSDSLSRRIVDRDRLELECPWEGYERGKRDAEAQKAVIEPQLNALEASRSNLREVNARIESLHEHIKAHDRDLAKLAAQRAQLDETNTAHQQAREALSSAEQRKASARDTLLKARALFLAADKQQRRTSLESELTRTDSEIRRIENVLERSATFRSSIADMRAQAAATSLTKTELNKLEKLEQKRRDNRIQREAISTRLVYRLDAGKCVDAGELGRLEGAGSKQITAPVTLQIKGVGEIDIRPGGEDIERLSAEGNKLDGAVEKLCGQLGIGDLAEAQTRHAHFLQLERDIALAQKQRDTLLDDDSEDAWRDKLADAQGRNSDVACQLASLPAAEAGMSVDAAQRALDDAEIEARETDEIFESLQRAAALGELVCATLGASIESESQRLDGELAMRAAEKRQLEFDEAVARKNVLQTEIGTKEATLDERNPAMIDADIQRYTLAVIQVQNERRQIRDAISSDRATLEAFGAAGIDEKLAVEEENATRLERSVCQYQLRADALGLLDTSLSKRQDEATQRLYAPLRNKLEHYLNILFPGTSFTIGIDELRPTTLGRNGQELEMDAHSHGTREQLGVIARFAYADLLKEAGQPTLLILDDALVHSDDDRRQQMKRIIHDASQRHQILLFTCHPDDWRDAGARKMMDVANLQSAS